MEKEFNCREHVLQNKILIAITAVFLAYLAYNIRNYLLILFTAFVIASSFKNLVLTLKEKGVPDIIASLIPPALIIITLIGLILPLVNVVVDQSPKVFSSLQKNADNLNNFLPENLLRGDFLQTLIDRFTNTDLEVFSITGSIIEVFLLFFLLLFVIFYFLYDYKSLRKYFLGLFNLNNKDKAKSALDESEKRLGAWLRGQIFLSLLVGVFSYLVYLLIGLPYALTLAFLAGVLEIIPNLGPVLAVIPALLLALTISPTTSIYVLIAYIIIQTLESYILVPKIIGDTVDLHPIVPVLAILFGAHFFGTLGALLAVPIFVTVKVIWKTWS